MGIFDKAREKAEQLIGEAKEKFGQMTGNESLENAVHRDQLSEEVGEVKETGETGHELRDNVADAVHDVKEESSGDGK